MARIAGVEIPKNKIIEVGLARIYGLGRSAGRSICAELGFNPLRKIGDLTDDEVYKLQRHIAQGYKVEGELRREIAQNVKRLMDIGSYSGLRHRKSLPVRGQRTRTNARTRKGPRKTVGRSKKAAVAPGKKG